MKRFTLDEEIQQDVMKTFVRRKYLCRNSIYIIAGVKTLLLTDLEKLLFLMG